MKRVKKEEEYWDLLDQDGQPTGKIHKRGEILQEGMYHRIVHAAIMNSEEQMLIQRRQPWKKWWPNVWDISAGGCVQAGETSGEAMVREVKEELGIKVDVAGMRPVMTLSYDHGFDDYYIFYLDVKVSELKLQKEEVREAKWADREEILQLQKQGLMVSYLFVEQFFQMRDHNGAIADGTSNLSLIYAEKAQIPSWMNLVEMMKEYYPGLDMKQYQETLEKYIEKKQALCMMAGNRVVGALLFSTSQGRLCFLAVHPDFRRRGVATSLVKEMKRSLSDSKQILLQK